MVVRVGVLAIGNEVVEGQILNRNAAWLSEKLLLMGAQPVFHLSCRDQQDEILQSLNFLNNHCHLILVSGGLGPTRDDMTRQSLSSWLGCPLEFNESLWGTIKEKLELRNVTLREGHRNQALLPLGAQPLANSRGVAPGFFIKASQCFLASLPGPPTELQAMFEDHLQPLIVKELAPRLESTLKSWVCLGAPESEIAHIVESIVGDSLEISYRLHKPYVEVKLWLPQTLDDSLNKRLALMEEKLQPWWVADTVPAIRKRFHSFLSQFEHVFVIDHLSSGLMLEKLKEDQRSDHLRYQCFEHKSFRFFDKQEVQGILQHMNSEMKKENLFLSLFPESESSAFIAFNNDIQSVKLPRNIPVKSHLGQLYIIENCFLKMNRQI